MIVDRQKTVKTTKRTNLRIEYIDLINMLRAAGFAVPSSAAFHVNVPGGGDWSNCALPIDGKCPVYVSWTEETTVEE